jgi:hypothetical protein
MMKHVIGEKWAAIRIDTIHRICGAIHEQSNQSQEKQLL